jgi:CRISPR-associated protein Cas1
MYSMRFGEDAPERRSVEQLRGMEGARVKRLCELHARENAVNCRRRNHDPANCSGPDTPNR